MKRWMVELQRKGTLVDAWRGKGLCLLAKGSRSKVSEKLEKVPPILMHFCE